MDWKSTEAAGDGAWKIPGRWLNLYYFEAFNILFRFENALRLFVYVVLKANLGKDWDRTCINGNNETIRSEARKRLNQARDYGYLGENVSAAMLYLNSGELIHIISSEACWKYFGQYFIASKQIVVTKLQEIGTVRNSLAHFRPIKQEDVDLIKQNCRHLLPRVEDFLSKLTGITNLVPTNRTDAWYREIVAIQCEHISISCYASHDNQWVRVQLIYTTPTLAHTPYGDNFSHFRVAKFRVNQLFEKYSDLCDSCIFITENPIGANVDGNRSISLHKYISIVLSRESLVKYLELVRTSLAEICSSVEKEVALLRQDHLARGDLVESFNLYATQEKDEAGNSKWSVPVKDMDISISEFPRVEYWGRRWYFEGEFIAAVGHYPWMPTAVSREPNFFGF